MSFFEHPVSNVEYLCFRVAASKSPVMSSQNSTIADPNPQKIGMVMKVKCKALFGLLFVTKYESGRKGKSILVQNKWITPNEFEKLSGSKSKKHLVSIKYHSQYYIR